MSVLEQHSQLVGGGSESRDHVAWAWGGDSDTGGQPTCYMGWKGSENRCRA